MKFSRNSFAWFGTGAIALTLGFFINSSQLCVISSCAGKGTIFYYLAILAIVLGLAVNYVEKIVKKMSKKKT